VCSLREVCLRKFNLSQFPPECPFHLLTWKMYYTGMSNTLHENVRKTACSLANQECHQKGKHCSILYHIQPQRTDAIFLMGNLGQHPPGGSWDLCGQEVVERNVPAVRILNPDFVQLPS